MQHDHYVTLPYPLDCASKIDVKYNFEFEDALGVITQQLLRFKNKGSNSWRRCENTHCVKSVRIRSYSGPYFSAFGLNKAKKGVSLRIQSKCGKMRARITPNTDTFQAVTFDYVFEAYLGELILGHSDNLSKFLQNSNLPGIDGRFTANSTVETLKSIKNDENFDLFWEKVLPHAKRLDVNEPTLPR